MAYLMSRTRTGTSGPHSESSLERSASLRRLGLTALSDLNCRRLLTLANGRNWAIHYYRLVVSHSDQEIWAWEYTGPLAEVMLRHSNHFELRRESHL